MSIHVSQVKRRATTKFTVLFAVLAALLAYWRVKSVSNHIPIYLRNNSLPQDDNRSSAFSVRRGVSVETAIRQDVVAAAAAEIAIATTEAKIVPGLGEGGVAVHLTGEQEDLARKIASIEAFNLFLSDQVALNRSLPDGRHAMCKRDWRDDEELPTASVIIVFHNEPRSTLLRTVHSVVNRSPPHLLREVILVDDFSDREELQYELDYYLLTRFRGLVRRVRLPRRWGLVRARLVGAQAAKGQTLVFLDAHCEVTEQWLEPLLQHVHVDRRAVAVPIIDVIHADTLEYKPRDSDNFTVGGFKWDGHFDWIQVPPAEVLRRGNPANPTRTPVMAGGLFAMNREYFYEVGSYDERMDLWGGENLEMSFRVWMCGGSIAVIPCSRVGHIFRKFSPYKFPGNKDSHGINTARMAHVWMDDYKRLLFLNRPDLKYVNTGDLSSRLELRQRLQCQNFQWYLENVYPHKFIADEHAQAYGKVRPRAVAPHLCVQTQNINTDDRTLIINSCHSDHRTSTQIFALSARGELRLDNDCVELSTNDSRKLCVKKCYPLGPLEGQEWEYTQRSQIRHKESGLCIEASSTEQSSEVTVTTCSHSLNQIWTFENFYLLDKNHSVVVSNNNVST